MYCVQIFSSVDWKATKKFFKIYPQDIKNYPIDQYFQHIINGEKFIFYRSNGTKTTSAAAAQYAILTWKPKIIFVLGTCGGVSVHFKKLDIVIASLTGHYDCNNKMTPDKEIFYKKTKVNFDNSWIDFKSLSDVHSGIVGSADQDVSIDNIDYLRQNNLAAADWGSGSAAAICHLNKVPCCIALGITDFPDKTKNNSISNQKSEYLKNSPTIMKKLINNILPTLLTNFQNNYETRS